MTAPNEQAAEITATALDYFEGSFDGDVARMRRALHPGLAKRALENDGWTLDETSAEWMFDGWKIVNALWRFRPGRQDEDS